MITTICKARLLTIIDRSITKLMIILISVLAVPSLSIAKNVIGYNENRDSNIKGISIISGKVKFSLASDLVIVSEAQLASTYPNIKERPTYLFENKATKTKFSINYGSTNANDNDLQQMKNYFENIYVKSGSNLISSDIKMVNRKQFVIMKFSSTNIFGEKSYNFLFFTTITGKLFMANYSGPWTQRKYNEDQGNGILTSIKVKD